MALPLLVACSVALGAPEGCIPTPDGTHDSPSFVDLLAHPELAETRFGSVLVIRPGDPGGAKYTLGGWRTGVEPAGPAGDGSAAVIPGPTGALHFATDADGPVELAVRARPLQGRWVEVFLDGDLLARGLAPAPGEPVTVRAVTDAPVRRAQHGIVIKSEASALLEWVMVGEPGASMPVDPEGSQAQPGQMVLHRGWTLGYPLQVPPGATLDVHLQAVAPARMRLDAVLDDGAVVNLAGAASGKRSLVVDLAPLAREVVRIEMTALGGDVTLTRAVVTVAASTGAPAPHVHPRNVLMVLADTQRADRLTVYDPSARPRTPDIEALASGSAVFEGARTHANWTKPSVATLMSSMLPWEHGVTARNARVPDQIALLPEILHEKGWQTAAFVTNSYVSDAYGFHRGWDHWSHSQQNHHARAAQVVDDVLGWLDTRDGEQPFFAYVHLTDTHSPYVPPAEVLERYDPGPYEGIADFELDPLLIHTVRTGACELGPRDRERFVALYDGEVDAQSTQIGALLEGLGVRGLADDTMVILVADHGEELFDHGSVGHGRTYYEEVMRVPLVVRWPSVTDGGMRIGRPVGLVDVAPTVLEALGLAVPGTMSGTSLVADILGQQTGSSMAVVGGHKLHWRAAWAGDYKLVARATSRHALSFVLTDLAADPHELRDVSCEHPLVTSWLRALMGLRIAATAPGSWAVPGAWVTPDAATSEQLRSLGYTIH